MLWKAVFKCTEGVGFGCAFIVQIGFEDSIFAEFTHEEYVGSFAYGDSVATPNVTDDEKCPRDD